jgi:ornithine cyclodeaminase
MEDIVLINNHFIENNTKYLDLIKALQEGFSLNAILVPKRHHHDFPNPTMNEDSSLLLMPAWNPSKESGVKIVTVSPENGKFNLPSINGTYIYLDAVKGTIKSILDAKSLTAKRTAAASALASTYLSRSDSNSLLMIGTGALSVNLIKAHTSVRPIKKVFIWGRNFQKAQEIALKLKDEKFTIQAIRSIKEKISEVDIISSATLSKIPLIFGKHLKEGQHIDLVGAYKIDMREADDEVISKASVYLDTYQGGLNESGDILIPLKTGIIKEREIKADLFELCSEDKKGRRSTTEITLFKSVGHALEDLVAAKYYYNQFINE